MPRNYEDNGFPSDAARLLETLWSWTTGPFVDWGVTHPVYLLLPVLCVVGYFLLLRATGSHVYIMVREPDRFVKIGETGNLDERIREGRTWIPEGLDYYSTVRVFGKRRAKKLEAQIHSNLAHLRMNRGKDQSAGGEWFHIHPVHALWAVRRAQLQTSSIGWLTFKTRATYRQRVILHPRRSTKIALTGIATAAVVLMAVLGMLDSAPIMTERTPEETVTASP